MDRLLATIERRIRRLMTRLGVLADEVEGECR
jgi:hypothetical protein